MQISNTGKAIQVIILSALLALLTGCVVGQKIDTAYQASAPSGVVQTNTAAVEVNEHRAYVLDGDKDPAFIGKFRAGFGNPWDVKTEGEIPLAELLKQDIGSELNSRGFDLKSDSEADRRLRVAINDWNFDAYSNGVFTYNLVVDVFDGDSITLTTETFAGRKVVEGSFWSGAKAAFEREMPKLYAEIIQTILAENGKVVDALVKPLPRANRN